MAKISKAEIDKNLRNEVFKDIFNSEGGVLYDWKKINDRQYGVILVDANGDERYVRIGAIVAELREDMTAQELMQSEIDAFNAKQEAKAEKAKEKAKKIAEDKAKREKEKAKEEGE